ncbi:hypothetical protein B0T16DRAFT_491335 [Cercophora newfieldiana]|uniref:Uncharacterized protein n=1 Tax=Cercophora newfieldiana TaxID=92897 RepID=A0AA39YAV5_9PEZI|nr:hypothetical protein B0T16DRAFT_491335 [Cercophora newfieldiana]
MGKDKDKKGKATDKDKDRGKKRDRNSHSSTPEGQPERSRPRAIAPSPLTASDPALNPYAAPQNPYTTAQDQYVALKPPGCPNWGQAWAPQCTEWNLGAIEGYCAPCLEAAGGAQAPYRVCRSYQDNAAHDCAGWIFGTEDNNLGYCDPCYGQRLDAESAADGPPPKTICTNFNQGITPMCRRWVTGGKDVPNELGYCSYCIAKYKRQLKKGEEGGQKKK